MNFINQLYDPAVLPPGEKIRYRIGEELYTRDCLQSGSFCSTIVRAIGQAERGRQKTTLVGSRCRSGSTRHFRCDHVNDLIYSSYVTTFACIFCTLFLYLPWFSHLLRYTSECHGTIIWGYFKTHSTGKKTARSLTQNSENITHKGNINPPSN
jgi:hypothetical protein